MNRLPVAVFFLALLLVAIGCGGEATQVVAPEVRASCAGLSDGCGIDGVSCCTAPTAKGGAFNRFQDENWPATISSFALGRFEVTVGRMRSFVDGYPGTLPSAGAAAHPKVPGSGWQVTWAAEIPLSQQDLRTFLAECPDDTTSPGRQTWTNEVGDHENAPMTCVSWYLAFAFCAFDGGRLPTDAEWNYAIAGGEEQRPFPWGETQPVEGQGHLWFDGLPEPDKFVLVGSYPAGAARWGHLDMMGSLVELTFDSTGNMEKQGAWSAPSQCLDCALFGGELDIARAVRDITYFTPAIDGDFYSPASGRRAIGPGVGLNGVGFRCAYDIPQ